MKFEQAKQIASKAIEELSQALERGHGEGMRDYLKAMARFHRYSAYNVMLVLSQRPNATRVAGYQTWKQFGRYVKKGAKGILVLAPVLRKKAVEEASKEEDSAKVLVGLIGDFCRAFTWTPLQRYYARIYTTTEDYRTARHVHSYKVLILITPTGNRLATDTDVVARGDSSFVLSDQAIKSGAQGVEWQSKPFENWKLHALLRHPIYRDESLLALSKPAWFGAFVILFGGLLFAVPKDLARARQLRQGRRLKGPKLVTAVQFNRRNKSNGIGFIQERSFLNRVVRSARLVRIPRRIESSHILIMGDTGTGKSALIRQLLIEVERRGESAIVYDPALEYMPQFFDPSRGDIVLNPLDQRMPYWTPGAELRHDAEALTLAASLFPDRHNENPFFVEGRQAHFPDIAGGHGRLSLAQIAYVERKHPHGSGECLTLLF